MYTYCLLMKQDFWIKPVLVLFWSSALFSFKLYNRDIAAHQQILELQ